jgi:Fur family ferric uptake transcriptional regulator
MCRKLSAKKIAPKLRMTEQRRAVLDEVRLLGSHPGAEEVYAGVRSRIPRISLATVYRNLEKLTEYGLLRRLEPRGARRRYDDRLTDHYHVRCLACGSVEDVEIDRLSAPEAAAAQMSGYEVQGHRLEFVGLCPRCMAARRTRLKKRRDGRREAAK